MSEPHRTVTDPDSVAEPVPDALHDHHSTGSEAGAAQRWRRRFGVERPAWTAAGFLALLSMVAVAAPLFAPFDPLHQDLSALLQGPSRTHPFGTDELGRDLLSRVIFGSRISLATARDRGGRRRNDRSAVGTDRGLHRRRRRGHHHALHGLPVGRSGHSARNNGRRGPRRRGSVRPRSR